MIGIFAGIPITAQAITGLRHQDSILLRKVRYVNYVIFGYYSITLSQTTD